MEIFESLKNSKIKSFIFDFLLMYAVFFMSNFVFEVQWENFMAWYRDDPTLKSASVIPFLYKGIFKAFWVTLIYVIVMRSVNEKSIVPAKFN